MKSVFIGLFILTVTGCSTTDSQQLAKNDGKQTAREKIGYECETMPVLGTSIPKKVCTTRIERKTIEKNAKENVRKLKGKPILCKITDGWCNGI